MLREMERSKAGSPMLASLLFFFPFEVEWRLEGRCERWAFPCSQRVVHDVAPTSFLVRFASFFQWGHGGAFERLL